MVIKADTDIDIDFTDREKALEGLKFIKASLFDDEGRMRPHNTGVFFQNIPHDPITGLASLSTKEAENRGYFKVDFLNVSQYDGVRNEAHLLDLMNREPIWEMLDDDFFIEQLSQIHAHADLVKQHKPRSVEELAAVISIIRPAKRHLIGKSWPDIFAEVWIKPQPGDKGYDFKNSFFKKPHAISYSLGIVVQMNLMVENETGL